MKIFSLLFIFLLMFFVSCNNANDADTEYKNSEAIIIGYDMRLCVCCGGWIAEINKDTLRIWNMPDEFNKILNEKKLPVNVHLSWKLMTDGCGASMKDIIIINSINLR